MTTAAHRLSVRHTQITGGSKSTPAVCSSCNLLCSRTDESFLSVEIAILQVYHFWGAFNYYPSTSHRSVFLPEIPISEGPLQYFEKCNKNHNNCCKKYTPQGLAVTAVGKSCCLPPDYSELKDDLQLCHTHQAEPQQTTASPEAHQEADLC